MAENDKGDFRNMNDPLSKVTIGVGGGFKLLDFSTAQLHDCWILETRRLLVKRSEYQNAQPSKPLS